MEDDPRAGKILDALKSEFPKGFEQYQAWFTKAVGILGDPVAGRLAIKASCCRRNPNSDERLRV